MLSGGERETFEMWFPQSCGASCCVAPVGQACTKNRNGASMWNMTDHGAKAMPQHLYGMLLLHPKSRAFANRRNALLRQNSHEAFVNRSFTRYKASEHPPKKRFPGQENATKKSHSPTKTTINRLLIRFFLQTDIEIAE